MWTNVDTVHQEGSEMNLRSLAYADKWMAVPLAETGNTVSDQVFFGGGGGQAVPISLVLGLLSLRFLWDTPRDVEETDTK